jgi:hypothetical protein
MRKRKPNAIETAWKNFFSDKKPEDSKKLYEEGWRSPNDIAAQLKTTIAAARMLCRRASESGEFEAKKVRVNNGSSLREMFYYRPKSTP